MEARGLKKKITILKLRISLLERLEEWLQERLSRIQMRKAGYEEEKKDAAEELEEILCPKQPICFGEKVVAREFLASYGLKKFFEELKSLPRGVDSSVELRYNTPKGIESFSKKRIQEKLPDGNIREFLLEGEEIIGRWCSCRKMVEHVNEDVDKEVRIYWFDCLNPADYLHVQMLASVGDNAPEYYVVDVKYSETERTKEGYPIVEEIKSRDFHFKFETSKKLSQEAKNQKIYSSITKGEQIAYCETVYKSLLDIEVAYVDPRILLGISKEQYYKRYGSKEWQDAWCDALGKRFGSEKDHLKVTLASSKADGEGAMDIYRIEMVGSRSVASESAA